MCNTTVTNTSAEDGDKLAIRFDLSITDSDRNLFLRFKEECKRINRNPSQVIIGLIRLYMEENTKNA